MQFQYTLYIWPLVVSALVSIALGIYISIRQRSAKGAKCFILSMLVVTIWSLSNALEMSGSDFATKLFWANMQYIAYCYSPVTLLALCMEFTGYDEWVQNKKILLVAVLPTIILILVWTDTRHYLMRYDMKLDYSGAFSVIAKKYGPMFFVHAVYSHCLNLTAAILLLRTVLFRNTIYRRQAGALLIGMCFIMLPNMMYILGISPIKRFDITPVFFGPAGLFIAWGIFRYKLFDVIPVARATVIETMDAGVMILDLQNRILDINPSFEKIINCTVAQASTKNIKEVCSNIPEFVSACEDRRTARSEFLIKVNDVSKVYEALLSQLTDNKGNLIGRLAVTYDITEKRQKEQEFLKQQWKLAVTEERERLARDMHDNLGQVLGFINLQAQGIRKELINAGIDIASERLDKLADVTQSAHDEIREYISSVRSAEAMEKDFITALSRIIMGFEERTSIRVKLDLPEKFVWEELRPNKRINILNIVKEALNNIEKYAQASQVGISFSFVEGRLCVTIGDDGKGFDIDQQNSGVKGKFGLKIMRERASELGALIEISSTKGIGSKIVLCIPIDEGGKIDANEIDAGG